MIAEQETPARTMLSLSEVDRILALRRGAASYYRTRGIIAAERGPGRAWVVPADALPEIMAAIREAKGGDGLTVREVAARLGIVEPTVYSLLSKGRLTRTGDAGRVRVDAASVEAYDRRRSRNRQGGG